MARVHYFSFIADDNGQPLSGANVSIYLAGSSVAAKIFETEIGGSYVSTLPQVITNSKGFFEFWVSDDSSLNGYSNDQKFKIAWSKTGVSSGYIDWIDIFSNILPVDETNISSGVRNKAVSDRLAYRWENHRNHDVSVNFFPIHGLEPFDITSTTNRNNGVFDSDDEKINKVISDKYAFMWNNHGSYSFAISASSGVNDIYNTTAHGLEPAEFGANGEIYNKLVSNALLKRYASVNGLQSFTHPVSGVYPENNGHLTTKEYVDSLSQTFSVSASDWSPSGGDYVYDLDHGMEVEYPLITIWDSNTNLVESISNIEMIDEDTIRLYSSVLKNLVIRLGK